MRLHLERDLEFMHPMSKDVRGFHYEAVFELQEVLCMKGHLGSQTHEGGDQSDLHMLPLNILHDNPSYLLLIR